MAYRLGVVGLGHWFEMMHKGISKSNQIVLSKVAGVRSFDEKREEMERIGIKEKDYFQIRDNLLYIPDEFFDELDIVQISDPNMYHSSQTRAALKKGLFVITEKTWATSAAEFDDFVKFVEDNGYQGNAYLHLHYLHKLLNLNLPAILERIVPKHGRITNFSATFFEEANEADMRRSSWMFSMENGGIFMDWIHPYEILFVGAKAEKIGIYRMGNFILNSDYDPSNPTGVEAFVNVSGRYFAENAKGVIRIGKGLPHETGLKRIVFMLESGKKLYLNFVGSQIEYNSDSRGDWRLVAESSESCDIIESGIPKGPLTSELLVKDILDMFSGGKPFLTLDMAIKIFGPQWDYQRLSREQKNISNQGETDRFIHEGLSSGLA